MAAVAIPPSPQVVPTMSNRRVPLASLQHATNSPLRATHVGGKRQRSHASEQRDLPYGQPPPKKQIVEVDDAEARRYGLASRRSGAPVTAFQKKLEAARDGKPAPRQADRNQRAVQVNENLDSIRQWQKHYRKMFPTFVFYFESIPDNVKNQVLRQSALLGARRVEFFSKEVTHVITTRPIPPEVDTSSSSNAKGTVNPAQLDSKKTIFDFALQKANGGDILVKARELGMKIWTAEKLQRMLHTMFNTDTSGQSAGYVQQHGTIVPQSRLTRRGDLSKLLQDEKLKDRDYSIVSHDVVQLRGFYIYIHDMDELTKPVMIREYPKVTKKEDGKWPQFRVSGLGKCPFVIDPHHMRKQEQLQEARAVKAVAPRTRAAAAQEEKRAALAETTQVVRRTSATTSQTVKGEEAKPLDPPGVIPAKRTKTDSMPPLFGSAQANIRSIPRFAGGEPVASGIQPSNITSAIHSKWISSTAAAPGARAGNTKEVNLLKRKVLEKNSVPVEKPGANVVDDMRTVLNQENIHPPPRAAKRKAQDALGYIREEQPAVEEEKQMRKAAIVRRRKTPNKDPKPGYCENCGEKFNDFDDHIESRKHRKFAMTQDNWVELDQLLDQLVRR